jgi:glycosyltransferase involved in cell wall biosynthesis
MILHLIETGGPGGAEQMLLRLADEYGQRGLPQLVCLRKDGWLAEEVRRRGLPLEIRPLGRLPDLGWLRELRQLVRAYKVTAIHAHEFAMNIRAAMLAKYLGLPSVATVHGKGYYTDKLSRRLAYRGASWMSNIVAVSEDIRNQLVNLVGISPHRVSMIPNGVDTERFRFDAEKRSAIRSQLGVGLDQLLIGSIGSYYPVKGHKFLVEAMKRVVVNGRTVKLVMAGQGPLAGELREQVNENNLKENVQIVGYIDDTPGLLSALDIFVMPSLSEGLPLALLEAAANGRCIVASKVGGIPEIITDNENGILVSPGDVDALAGALARALNEPERRKALGKCAEKIAQNSWSIRRTADLYLALLQRGRAARCDMPNQCDS